MLGYNCTISLRLSSQAWDFSPMLMIFSGISTVSELLGRLYYYDPITGNPGKLPTNVNNVVTGVALVGRKKVYGVTLIITVICAIGSRISFGSSAKSVIGTLCFFRFWLGFGIGGDYPLSATIMSEYMQTRKLVGNL
uniref:Uncharacterized protein n=1 Tax=Populus alba TaxID=43335 RepID=A0A4U5R199_POPAL|nr:hypothetical protein D5086_0000014640 [Populus alba]